MHYFIIEKILGIPGKEQRKSEHILFDRSFPDRLKKVIKGEAQMAIITNEVSIDDEAHLSKWIHDATKVNLLLSKVICGFLFSSVKESEFVNPVFAPFS